MFCLRHQEFIHRGHTKCLASALPSLENIVSGNYRDSNDGIFAKVTLQSIFIDGGKDVAMIMHIQKLKKSENDSLLQEDS